MTKITHFFSINSVLIRSWS